MTRPRIFSISYDPSLLATRDLMLTQVGYDVVGALGFAEALEKGGGDFDLIIMGHSIPPRDKRAIVTELRQRGCNAPVLTLLRYGDTPIPEAARAIDPDPQRLLDTVQEMLAPHQAKQA